MSELLELQKQMAELRAAVTLLQVPQPTAIDALFTPWKTIKTTPEIIEQRYSEELGITLERRPKHGPGIFRVELDGRLTVFHSTLTHSGGDHVHCWSGRFRLAGSKNDGIGVYERLEERVVRGREILWLIKYSALNVADPLHEPTRTSANIKLMSVEIVSIDGVLQGFDLPLRWSLE